VVLGSVTWAGALMGLNAVAPKPIKLPTAQTTAANTALIAPPRPDFPAISQLDTTVKTRGHHHQFRSVGPSDQLSQIRFYKEFEFLAPEEGKPVMVNIFWQNFGPSTVELLTRARVSVSLSKSDQPIPGSDWPNIASAESIPLRKT